MVGDWLFGIKRTHTEIMCLIIYIYIYIYIYTHCNQDIRDPDIREIRI